MMSTRSAGAPAHARRRIVALLEGIGDLLDGWFGPLRSFPPFWSDPVLALQEAAAVLVLLVAIPIWLVLNWPRWLEAGMEPLRVLGLIVLVAYLVDRRPPSAPARRRPIVVTVAAVVLASSGILSAWYGGLTPFPPFTSRPVPVLWDIVGALLLLAAVGIWRLRDWARWLGVGLQAVTLAYPLLLLAYGMAHGRVGTSGLFLGLVDAPITTASAAAVLWALLRRWPPPVTARPDDAAASDPGIIPSCSPVGKRRRGWQVRSRRR